jgi:hypothetical protein
MEIRERFADQDNSNEVRRGYPAQAQKKQGTTS